MNRLTVILAATLFAAAAAGCGSSVTGVRDASPLPKIDTMAVDATAHVQTDARGRERLVVLATGQHTALDADFDLFLALALAPVKPGAERTLTADERASVVVIRSSGDVSAFVVQTFDVAEGRLRWEGRRPVLDLKAESRSRSHATLAQVPAWSRIETTLRCDTDAEAFDRMARRFCAECLMDPSPRGPVEQVVRILRKLDEAAGQVEQAVNPFAPHR